MFGIYYIHVINIYIQVITFKVKIWKTLRRIVNTNIRCNMYEKLMQSL